MIISLTACGEPDEYSEEWYKKQIYIERICIEKGKTDETPIKVKVVISNYSKKPINYGVFIRGRFCDDDGNAINGLYTTPLILSIERKINNEALSCEFNYENRFTAEDVSKIATFKIEEILVGYYFDEKEETEDYLTIKDDELNYVISPDVYKDDYNKYTEKIQTVTGESY